MSTEMMEFHATNSPWTEMYDLHCQREDAANSQTMDMADQDAEQEPTHHALADVYNRDDAEDNSKRF